MYQKLCRGSWFALIILLSGAVVNRTPVFAQTADTLSLKQLIDEALSNNRSVMSASKQYEASKEVPKQVSTLPDPSLSYTYFPSSLETRLGPQRHMISASQTFPFFGKLRLQKEIAESRAEVFDQQFEISKRDILYKVKKAYYDLFWIQQSIRILTEYDDILGSFISVAQTKYATGTGNQQAVLKAQVELSAIDEKIISFNQQEKKIIAALNGLLNRDVQSPLFVAATLDTVFLEVAESDLLSMVIDDKQELKAVKSMIQMETLKSQLFKKQYYPDFSVGINYFDLGERTDADPKDNGRNAYNIMLKVNVPIWWNKYRSGVAESQLNVQSNQYLYEDISNTAFSELSDNYFKLGSLQETIRLYARKIIPESEQTLNVSIFEYSTGTIEFLSLLDSERMILGFKLNYYRLLSDYHKSVNEIERIVGRPITKTN